MPHVKNLSLALRRAANLPKNLSLSLWFQLFLINARPGLTTYSSDDTFRTFLPFVTL